MGRTTLWTMGQAEHSLVTNNYKDLRVQNSSYFKKLTGNTKLIAPMLGANYRLNIMPCAY